MIANLAARLDQLRLRQGGSGNQQPRAEAEHGGDAVWLGNDGCTQFERGGADADALAEVEVEAGQQVGIDDRTPDTAALIEQAIEGTGGLGPHAANQGIGAVDGLQLDHGAFVANRRRTGHRPHLNDLGKCAAVRPQVGRLFRRRRTVQKADVDVAAE